VQDDKCIFLWGFKIAFGGQRSTGFGVIYDNLNAAKKSLSKHLLLREKIIEKPKGGLCCASTLFSITSVLQLSLLHNSNYFCLSALARKARKERNTKVKKVRGKEKVEVRSGKAVAKKKEK
jgi:hypothetical protein